MIAAASWTSRARPSTKETASEASDSPGLNQKQREGEMVRFVWNPRLADNAITQTTSRAPTASSPRIPDLRAKRSGGIATRLAL